MDKGLVEAFKKLGGWFKRGFQNTPKQPRTKATVDMTWPLAANNVPFKFKQLLGGPATYVRVLTSVNCQVFLRNYAEVRAGDSSDYEDFEGTTGGIPRNYTNENLFWMQFVPAAYPVRIRMYASRVDPEEGGE